MAKGKGTVMAGKQYQILKVLAANLCGAEQDTPEGSGRQNRQALWATGGVLVFIRR